jgi:hypothetical protein
MGANIVHAFNCTLSEPVGAGVPGGEIGPNEWNAAHLLYLDVNAQTGTSYAIQATDLGALVTFANTSAIAATIARAVAGLAPAGAAPGFYKGWFCFLKNVGNSTVTITPSTSTINGKTSDTLAPGHYGMLVSDGTNYQLLRISISQNSSPLPQSYLAGFALSNDGTSPNSVIDVSAGQARDSTNTFNLVTTATFYKSTAGAWAAGAGASGAPVNGMGNGLTVAASTWYHVHAILLSTGATDVYFDTSATAANAPSGTIAYRRIGAVKTDASAHFLAFTQFGDDFLWSVPVADQSGASVPTSPTLITLTVPPGIKVLAKCRILISNGANGGGMLVQSPDETSAVANVTPGNEDLNALAGGTDACDIQVRTSTSAQVRWSAAASGISGFVITTGYIDRRGRDA